MCIFIKTHVIIVRVDILIYIIWRIYIMKKNILSILVCGAVAFTVSGFAATTVAPGSTSMLNRTATTNMTANSTEFSGAFVGANVGFDVASLKYKKAVTPKDTQDLGAQGPAGAIFAGYALNNNNWHYGAELTATYRDVTKKNLKTVDDANALQGSIQYYYGLDMELGRVVNNNTLLYVHGGPIYGRYKLTQPVADTNTGKTSNQSFHDSQFGGELGLGLNYGINAHLAVQAEYSYDFYKSFKFTPNTTIGEETIAPRVNNFNLGISYWFA